MGPRQLLRPQPRPHPRPCRWGTKPQMLLSTSPERLPLPEYSPFPPPPASSTPSPQRGGALPEADLESINLARILVDGEQIRVGIAGESPPPSTPEGDTAAGACVRLNTATETDLQTLPGIGPALAKRIITYRSTHPRLTSVDELDDVPGIGPSLIEKIRPGVCA